MLDPAAANELTAGPDLEAIASRLVRSIRAAQPAGPYFLGGFCSPGLLAYEAACQLIAAGQEVGMLVLVEAFHPLHFKQIGRYALMRSKARFQLTHFANLPAAQRAAYAAGRIGSAISRLISSAWRAAPNRYWGPFEQVLDEAALRYRPPTYPGRVALIQAADRLDVFDRGPGWVDAIKGEFAVHEIGGNHETMLEQPNVQQLADRLNACLRRARQFPQRRPVMRE
jgi:thioesterase domain-containing protein